MGDVVFAYNEALETAVLHDGLEKLGNFCFCVCSALKSVRLGEGMKEIGTDAFDSCTALERVDLPESLREIDSYAFYQSGLKELVIPDNVNRIGTLAFSCPSLTSLTFGNGLKSIGSHAFSEISVEEIVVPDSVTDVGICAFAFNDVLKKVTIGRGCTYLTYGMFAMCPSLETVTITTVVCSVCDSAFGGCEKLREIYFLGSEADWENCEVGEESDENPANGYGNIYFREADLYFYSEEPVYDGSHWGYRADGTRTVWEIASEADPHLIFEKRGESYAVTGLEEDCTHTEIVVPKTYEGLPVTAIGENAFQSRKQIERVALPSGIAEIGDYAFESCTSLEEITFPKKLKIIGKYAFHDAALKEATLPFALQEVNFAAFASCKSLTSVWIPKHAVLGDSAFCGCSALSSLNFEEGSGSEFIPSRNVCSPHARSAGELDRNPRLCFRYLRARRSHSAGAGKTHRSRGVQQVRVA